MITILAMHGESERVFERSYYTLDRSDLQMPLNLDVTEFTRPENKDWSDSLKPSEKTKVDRIFVFEDDHLVESLEFHNVIVLEQVDELTIRR